MPEQCLTPNWSLSCNFYFTFICFLGLIFPGNGMWQVTTNTVLFTRTNSGISHHCMNIVLKLRASTCNPCTVCMHTEHFSDLVSDSALVFLKSPNCLFRHGGNNRSIACVNKRSFTFVSEGLVHICFFCWPLSAGPFLLVLFVCTWSLLGCLWIWLLDHTGFVILLLFVVNFVVDVAFQKGWM